MAYRSQCPEHLLNVPAGKMSAFPDESSHFLDWLKANAPSHANASGFVPRGLFGRYVGEVLQQTLAETSLGLQWLEDEALSMSRQGTGAYVVQLRSGSELQAAYVILATGNFPPTDPAPFGRTSDHTYVKYAWSDDALHDVGEFDSILLLGSGLTAIDQVLALDGAGFKGHITLLSRRGLAPCVHHLGDRWEGEWARSLPRTARGLLAAVRREVNKAAANGSDWRAVIDSLRPHTQRTWAALPWDEQRRFLRHVRAYWDVHRHRFAPQVQQVLHKLQAENRLTVISGRVLECRNESHCAEVRYRTRATGAEATLRVDRIVNCTGPEADFRKLQDPLTRSLVMQGLARPDALSLGLDVAEQGSLLDADGVPSKALFAIGPLRKGCLWETTAVPEIREQAQALAIHLLTELESALAPSWITGVEHS